MPIKTVVCYVVTCDTCGDEFEGDYILHCHTQTEVREHVETFDGAVWGDHVWCENCIPLCTCGHLFREHDHGDAPCDECDCKEFAPVMKELPAEVGKEQGE